MTKKLSFVLTFALLMLVFTPIYANTQVTSVVVAPKDATDQIKAKADLVCDGVDDQAELLQSLMVGNTYESRAAGAPSSMPLHQAKARFSVTWLPGTYHLSGVIEFPVLSDFALYAEGTYLIFQPKEGDAIHINHSIRCRYNFGTIDSHSTGACITVTGLTMSEIAFTGLIGYDQKGTGLRLYGTSTAKYNGTDISGFDIGVLVDDISPKLDTNWFWFSYIRNCNTCIWEKGNHVDNNVWNVNVDATLPESVAIRIAGDMGYWHIIMGTYGFEGKNKAVIIEPGASDNFIYVQPPIDTFAWQDNSGNDTNALVSVNLFAELSKRMKIRQKPDVSAP